MKPESTKISRKKAFEELSGDSTYDFTKLSDALESAQNEDVRRTVIRFSRKLCRSGVETVAQPQSECDPESKPSSDELKTIKCRRCKVTVNRFPKTFCSKPFKKSLGASKYDFTRVAEALKSAQHGYAAEPVVILKKAHSGVATVAQPQIVGESMPNYELETMKNRGSNFIRADSLPNRPIEPKVFQTAEGKELDQKPNRMLEKERPFDLQGLSEALADVERRIRPRKLTPTGRIRSLVGHPGKSKSWHRFRSSSSH